MDDVIPLRKPLVNLSLGVIILLILPWFSGGQEMVARLLGVAALLAIVVIVWRQPQVRKLPWRGVPIWALGLLAWSIASLSWSVNRYQTVQWVILWVLAILAFSVTYRLAEYKQAQKLFQVGYLASVAMMVVYGLYLYLTVNYDRFTSSFYWPNPAAAYLIPALIFLTVDSEFKHKNKLFNWAQIIFGGVIGVAFLLAASRVATVILLICLVVLAVKYWTQKHFWINIVFISLIAILGTFGITYLRSNFIQSKTNTPVTNLGTRFVSAAKGETTNTSDRINYLLSAKNIWLDHVVLGTGAGTYSTVHPRYQIRVISASANAHNVYVQTFAELGTVGGLLLLLVIVSLLVGFGRSAWSNPSLLPWCIATIALFVHMAVDIDADYPSLVILAAVLAGFCYKTWEVKRVRPGWITPVLALGVLWPAISSYQSSSWAQAATTYQGNGDLTSAQTWYTKAHQVLVYDPDTINAEGIEYYTLAIIGEDKTANASLAIDRAKAAHRQDPLDAQHLFLLGRVYHLIGDNLKAKLAYQEMLKLDPYNHPEYYQVMARVQLESGDVKGALATCLLGTNQYSDSVIANRNLDATFGQSVAGLLVIQSHAKNLLGDQSGALRDNARAVRLIKAAQLLNRD